MSNQQACIVFSPLVRALAVDPVRAATVTSGCYRAFPIYARECGPICSASCRASELILASRVTRFRIEPTSSADFNSSLILVWSDILLVG